MLDTLCPPAILYLGFSLTQIIIDTFKGHYNTAFFKTIVMCIFTLLLNILCERGLSVISWLIVFIPFILMTYITAVLLFVFGLSPSNGKSNSNYNVKYPSDYPNEMLIARNPQHNEMIDDLDFDFTLPSLPPQFLTTQSSLQSQVIPPAVTPPATQQPVVTPPATQPPAVTQPAVQPPAVTQPTVTPPQQPQNLATPPLPPVPPQYSQYSQYSQYLQQMI
jgi:hypothetical protein